MPVLAILVLSLTVLACGADDCPVGTTKIGTRCVDDTDGGRDAAGGLDGARTDGPPSDATGCEPACSGERAMCDMSRGICVECTASSDCGPSRPLCSNIRGLCVECMDDSGCDEPLLCDTARGVCVGCRSDDDCEAPRPRCEEGRGECVACLEDVACTSAERPICSSFLGECAECEHDESCGDPGASRCDREAGACRDCRYDEDCAHLSGRTVCGDGTCVECTGDNASACGGTVCDATRRTCSTFAPGTAFTCAGCVSSAHCASGRVCVERSSEPAACYPLSDSGCERPLSASSSIQTVEGRWVSICHHYLAGCEAQRAVGDECDPREVDACPAGSSCHLEGGMTLATCALSCRDARDCPVSASCDSGSCVM